MKVYIGGPMRGYEKFNFPAFDAMAERLKQLGVTPVSPATLDREAENDEHVEDRPIEKFTSTLEDFMERDIRAMRDVDALLLLNGWATSRGSAVELAYARYRGIPIFQEREFDEFLTYLETFDNVKAKELI